MSHPSAKRIGSISSARVFASFPAGPLSRSAAVSTLATSSLIPTREILCAIGEVLPKRGGWQAAERGAARFHESSIRALESRSRDSNPGPPVYKTGALAN